MCISGVAFGKAVGLKEAGPTSNCPVAPLGVHACQVAPTTFKRRAAMTSSAASAARVSKGPTGNFCRPSCRFVNCDSPVTLAGALPIETTLVTALLHPVLTHSPDQCRRLPRRMLLPDEKNPEVSSKVFIASQ